MIDHKLEKLWGDAARWAVNSSHGDTRSEILDEYRQDAGLFLQDAIELLKEQDAEIAGLIRERDEALRARHELVLVTADAVRDIEASLAST